MSACSILDQLYNSFVINADYIRVLLMGKSIVGAKYLMENGSNFAKDLIDAPAFNVFGLMQVACFTAAFSSGVHHIGSADTSTRAVLQLFVLLLYFPWIE